MRIINIFVLLLLTLLAQPAWSQQDQTLPDGIMATRGEGSVSREMFEASVSRIPEKDRAGVVLSAERVKRILADLLLTSQLKADAHAASFDQGLMQYRMQLAADRELINAWLDYYVESQPPADYLSMAREYYQLNQETLMTVPSRDVTHLLVSNKQATDEEVKNQAQIYLDQIILDPSVFDQLVLDHSEDPGVRSNNGQYKEVKKGDMVSAFEKAAFALNSTGEFSGLVQTPYGIHIIRLDKINQQRVLTFEEVQDNLVAMKTEEHKERVRYSYLNELGSMEWQVSEKELKAMGDYYYGEDTVEESSKEPKSE